MATLVLSTVGNALGGPVGGAIGALIGQSIDQELLSAPRRGPRVGDLTVQTSSYGTQIPRIYGMMRVAGSVIWSTDLVEHQAEGGAKGQPDVTYSYTVSFAVALSSRVAISVKRIWADGNLLRGAAGDFKVGCKFRFYNGTADQLIDPLIGSVEGIANAPAYRGSAVAVFEDLALASFGNRIPFLTFEIEADGGVPALGSVLSDASAGLIANNVDVPLPGFAAYGSSIADSLGTLIDTFAVNLFDDGQVLRGPATKNPIAISDAEFGNSADTQPQPRIERQQAPVQSVPGSLRLSFYDPDRDYQSGEARALAGEQGRKESQMQLPAVLHSEAAKSLAQDVLARMFAKRHTMTLRLPPRYLGLEPGSLLSLPVNPSAWRVETCKVDGFVVVVELRPLVERADTAISADPGRVLPSPDVQPGPVTLALIDVPNPTGSSMNDPVVLVAASSNGAGWLRPTLQIDVGGQPIAIRSPAFKSVLGHAVTVLTDSAAELIDELNEVEVQLLDHDQWLTSRDDDALMAGANLAVIGNEVIQFGQALALGEGRFRLSQLLRARGGTEWATPGHAIGETFCMLNLASLQSVSLPAWALGATITATSTDGSDASRTFAGENVRPLCPVNLAPTTTSEGDLELTWTRRSRQGFAWVDGIDVPIGESRELYRVTITSRDSMLELTATEPRLTVAAADLVQFEGQVAIEVQQIGDFAASRPAQLTFDLP